MMPEETRVFWFPDMAVTAEHLRGSGRDRIWGLRIEARNPYVEFRTEWESFAWQAVLDQIYAAEDAIEALYMALVAEDFREAAAEEERDRFIRAAAQFGPERLTAAYREVLRRREKRERFLRRRRSGPKEWFPGP